MANRLLVWAALSELYLDTELLPDKIDRIVEILAASPYSGRELEDILLTEVHPACAVNLLQVAGIWSGFDGDWLRDRIVWRQRAWFRWPARLVPLRKAQRNRAMPMFARVEALRCRR